MRTVASSVFAAFFAALLATTAARAGDPVSGEAHFKKGKDLLAHGEIAAACAELVLADAADPTVGTLGLLAGCHEQLGQLATARDEYLATANRAKTSGDPRGDFAQKQADRLEPSIPRLRIDGIEPPPEGLVVSVDGKEVPRDRLRAPLRIDPGSHRLEARADGRAPFSTRFDASAGAEAHVTITLGAAPASVAAVAPAPAPLGVDETSAPRTWSRPLGFALIGVGGASLVASAVLGGVAIAKKNASQPCGGDNVADCASTRNAAYTFAGASTATFVGGLVAAGAGVVFVITAPAPKTNRAALELDASPAPGAAGFAVHATF